VADLLLCIRKLALKVLNLSTNSQMTVPNKMSLHQASHFMEDILLFVSLVNWHFTVRLMHSEQLEVSVASHFDKSVVDAA
jgi:hypothetical protein